MSATNPAVSSNPPVVESESLTNPGGTTGREFLALEAGIAAVNAEFIFVRSPQLVVRLSDMHIFNVDDFRGAAYANWRYEKKTKRIVDGKVIERARKSAV